MVIVSLGVGVCDDLGTDVESQSRTTLCPP